MRSKRALVLVLPFLAALTGKPAAAQTRDWMFGPFEKPRQVNPIITPRRASAFLSPVNDSSVH